MESKRLPFPTNRVRSTGIAVAGAHNSLSRQIGVVPSVLILFFIYWQTGL